MILSTCETASGEMSSPSRPLTCVLLCLVRVRVRVRVRGRVRVRVRVRG